MMPTFRLFFDILLHTRRKPRICSSKRVDNGRSKWRKPQVCAQMQLETQNVLLTHVLPYRLPLWQGATFKRLERLHNVEQQQHARLRRFRG